MEIIDVTLRESVYCEEYIPIEIGLEFIRRLSLTGIDYVEIGYLKKNCDTKSCFMNYDGKYINDACSVISGKTKLSAMIHPEDFYSNDWDREILKKLSLIRICINEENIGQVKNLVDFFHELGIKVSLNLTHISRYTVDQCMQIAKKGAEIGADFFYVADSNGNLLPEDVDLYIKALVENTDEKMRVGFHAHDNLSLAQMNTLRALENGAAIIDSSIQGFGKGAGNLRTELFPILLLRKKSSDNKYKFETLLEAALYFNRKITKMRNFEEQYKYSLLGAMNLGLSDDKKFKKLSLDNKVKESDIILAHLNQHNCK